MNQKNKETFKQKFWNFVKNTPKNNNNVHHINITNVEEFKICTEILSASINHEQNYKLIFRGHSNYDHKYKFERWNFNSSWRRSIKNILEENLEESKEIKISNSLFCKLLENQNSSEICKKKTNRNSGWISTFRQSYYYSFNWFYKEFWCCTIFC